MLHPNLYNGMGVGPAEQLHHRSKTEDQGEPDTA